MYMHNQLRWYHLCWFEERLKGLGRGDGEGGCWRELQRGQIRCLPNHVRVQWGGACLQLAWGSEPPRVRREREKIEEAHSGGTPLRAGVCRCELVCAASGRVCTCELVCALSGLSHCRAGGKSKEREEEGEARKRGEGSSVWTDDGEGYPPRYVLRGAAGGAGTCERVREEGREARKREDAARFGQMMGRATLLATSGPDYASSLTVKTLSRNCQDAVKFGPPPFFHGF